MTKLGTFVVAYGLNFGKMPVGLLSTSQGRKANKHLSLIPF